MKPSVAKANVGSASEARPICTEGQRLTEILRRNRHSRDTAVTSVCTAHELAIEAALKSAQSHGQIALIEATCNQVNQFGGYTGLRPEAFARRVRQLASKIGADVVLGGDHLGPQPWRELPAAAAMDHARALVEEYARAGFAKLHLDCSMRCADDPEALPEDVVAERASDLASIAETVAAENGLVPVYVIGTEVPAPGGMGATNHLKVSDPASVGETLAAHRLAFGRRGLDEAFDRVAAVVVQPGVDFGNEHVVHFQSGATSGLEAALPERPLVVFEAHSTDYQRPAAYVALVRAHFAILKVGPAVTFALREAFYALEHLESELVSQKEERSSLRASIESAMRRRPEAWQSHYKGDAETLAYLRHFSLSDRLRYYWQDAEVAESARRLITNLERRPLPLPLVSQYFPGAVRSIDEGRLAARPRDLILAHVETCLKPYAAAAGVHSV